MRIASLFLAAGVAACAGAPTCPEGTGAMWRAELLFGRDIDSRAGVSHEDWRDFAAAEIAPRFPAGFTVTDAAGAWRGADGTTVAEPSKIVMIVAPAGGDTRARLDAIAGAYKVRFHQESVGIVIEPACAAF